MSSENKRGKFFLLEFPCQIFLKVAKKKNKRHQPDFQNRGR